MYNRYFRDVTFLKTLDVYRVCRLFNVTDSAIAHAIKKLLLPGERTGGKSFYDDIKEARDTLTRCLEMMDEENEIHHLEKEAKKGSVAKRKS